MRSSPSGRCVISSTDFSLLASRTASISKQAIAVYRKLGASSRNDAVDRAAELGLADRPSGA